MCKEMPVLPVNKVVDPKRIIKKMECLGGGEAQEVVDQKNRRVDIFVNNGSWLDYIRSE
jgi:hypothetical protein